MWSSPGSITIFLMILCSHTIFNGWIKNVSTSSHKIVIFYFCTTTKYLLWLVSCILFTYDKTKRLIIPWRLCICVTNFDWFLFQFIEHLNPEFHCYKNFALFSIREVFSGTFCISFCKCWSTCIIRNNKKLKAS